MKIPEQGTRVQIEGTLVFIHRAPGQPEETAQVGVQTRDGQSLITNVRNLAPVEEPVPVAVKAVKGPPEDKGRRAGVNR